MPLHGDEAPHSVLSLDASAAAQVSRLYTANRHLHRQPHTPASCTLGIQRLAETLGLAEETGWHGLARARGLGRD